MKKMIILGSMLVCAFVGATSASAGKTLNDQLPDWIDVNVNVRHRYEFKSDFDFNEAKDDEKGFNLWRTRVNIALKPMDAVKLFYQLQDSRISDDSTVAGAKAGFEDWGETRQLWIEAWGDILENEPNELTRVGFKFGRQELAYGAQRLIGGFNWSNIAQTFDAGKVMVQFDPLDLVVDFFAGGKTPNKSPREQDDFYDGASNDRIGGYYATYKGLKDATIEQYVINRNTDGKTVSFGQTGDGEVDDYTIGGRIKGKIPETGFDYEVEAAWQTGDSGSLDAQANMAIAILGYTFDIEGKPRISFEFDYASGDNDPSDGDRETFNNLYPTNHLHYGYMDFASLQNLNNYRFQITTQPTEKLKLQADLHLIYLDTAKDNLYSAGRTIKRATTAGASRHVGNELDLIAKHKLCDYANLLIGYSHLWAGKYLDDTGTSADADFFYIQTSLNF